ncbi:hypothetical protein F1C76_01750 [Geodermatophilaceae bacterium NBWT11]|nr:hypothetical protein F1C76_01750 [Geodermatophilaceae bacterium NBWT11]
MTRRAPGRLAAVLADGETVVAVSDCVPLGDLAEEPVEATVRTAVLTDRSLYCSIGGADVVPLPFARMRELSQRGLALLFFRIDDSHATWELRDHRFAGRAERRFAQHGLLAHRAWVGTARDPGREPPAFRHHAHLDLLQRIAAGADPTAAAAEQRSLVDQLVFDTTGDRASCRAALRRIGAVHRRLQTDLALLADAAPSLAPAQHAQVLLDQPSPWEGPVADVDDVPTDAELAGLTPDGPLLVTSRRASG